MTSDSTLYEESYAAFLTEAQDILQRIEQDLLSLREDRSPAKVHRLMRSAHTLKGAAASVDLEIIKQIAHVLEDIFKALYNPDVVVDAEVEALLFQAYECLRFPLMAELTGRRTQEQEFLNRAAMIIAQLQEKLGDCFDREAPIPNSAELGFDVVQSLFEVGVQQRLQELAQAIGTGDADTVDVELRMKADIFLGLAESLNLSGFGAIAQTVLAALAAHPERILEVAKLALDDFVQGRTLVLAGDRTQGGSPSLALQALAGMESPRGSRQEAASRPMETPAEILADILADIPTEIPVDIPTETLSERFVEAAIPESSSEAASFSLDDVFGDMDISWETASTTANAASPPEAFSPEAFSPEASPEQPRVEQPVSHITAHVISRAANRLDASEAEPIHLSATPAAEPTEPQRIEPVRVDLEQLKHLDYLAGELLINQSKQTTQDQQLRTTMQALQSSLQQHQQTLYHLQDCVERLLGHLEHGTQPWAASLALTGTGASKASQSSFTPNFDVLEMERYSDLRVLVREALNETIQLDQTTETVDQVAKQSRRTLETQRRLLGQVRDDLTALQMHPLRELLNRFPRLLQQLAEVHGKPVEFVLNGTHVLVDKAIAEKLYDPLLHLIRNAFDHGIEPPHIRQAQGKPEIGKIEIRASQQGNQTVIEVKDDGQGINLQQVARRAIELNLISRDQINTIPESQLLDVLFQPGFSTVTNLSDLSGRGIGLDVVNSQLQAMNGSIAISTAPQQGTTFSLKIPLSLTTTRLLVCQAQEFAYVLPVEHVEQIIVPTADQLLISASQQLALRWQQEQGELLVPVYLLSELVSYSDISTRLASVAQIQSLGLRRSQVMPDGVQTAPVLMLQTIYGRRALMVDQVLGEHELVIRALGTAIAPPPYVYGCCILGSNRSALAIDIEALMQLTTEVEFLAPPPASPGTAPVQASQFLPTAGSSVPTRQLTGQANPGYVNPGYANRFQRSRSKVILVVDDSLTLRRHLTLVFEQAGYEVLQAGDGLEALSQLRHHRSIRLVVCDIEMPNLNGFEFLGQVQQDPELGKTPVVVLTSRSSAKHRQIACELGAVAYFTKPYDHTELVATVDRLLQPV